MNDLKAQIKFESAQAARLSREATTACEVKDWKRSLALMREAVAASKNCQRLIKELTQSDGVESQSEKARS